jgi:hypothetical protein
MIEILSRPQLHDFIGEVTRSRMTAHFRFVLIALSLQVCPSSLFAADITGWFDTDCSGVTFHIMKIDAVPAGQELVLRLSTGHIPILPFLLTGADWWDVHGERRYGVNELEQATQAKIWLDKPSKNRKHISRISGRYTVDLKGQHLEGRFEVKYRKPKNLIICE